MTAELELVPASAALAAPPSPVEMLQPTTARQAVRGRQAVARRARVAVVDVLRVIVEEVGARLPRPRDGIDRGSCAKDILHLHVDRPLAGGQVMVVEMVVGAHGGRVLGRDALDGVLCLVSPNIPRRTDSQVLFFLLAIRRGKLIST